MNSSKIYPIDYREFQIALKKTPYFQFWVKIEKKKTIGRDESFLAKE